MKSEELEKVLVYLEGCWKELEKEFHIPFITTRILIRPLWKIYWKLKEREENVACGSDNLG
jgi:hypothetical protein